MLEITDAIKEKLEYEFNTNLNVSAGIFLHEVSRFNTLDEIKEYVEQMKNIIGVFLRNNDFKTVDYFMDEIKEYVKILEIFGCEDYSKQTC